jgi:hypothetical protein
MRMPSGISLSRLCLLAFFTCFSSAAAQVLAPNLIYTSVLPCRVFDTRFAANGSNGRLIHGVTQTFNVVGDTTGSYFTGQGGTAGGCSVPGFAGSAAQTQAVVLNFVAVGAAGPGDLVAWPSEHAQPQSSIINYASSAALAGLNIANAIVLPVRQDSQGGDISIKAQVSDTDVLADVVGYFTSFPAVHRRQYYLTTLTSNGSLAQNACSVGYHMASIFELEDRSNLQYNAALGFTQLDDGGGPPVRAFGWLRTGGVADGTPTVPAGADCNVSFCAFNSGANCLAWSTSSGSAYGVAWALFLSIGFAGEQFTVPNAGGSHSVATTCDQSRRVWCVEN